MVRSYAVLRLDAAAIQKTWARNRSVEVPVISLQRRAVDFQVDVLRMLFKT